MAPQRPRKRSPSSPAKSGADRSLTGAALVTVMAPRSSGCSSIFRSSGCTLMMTLLFAQPLSQYVFEQRPVVDHGLPKILGRGTSLSGLRGEVSGNVGVIHGDVGKALVEVAGGVSSCLQRLCHQALCRGHRATRIVGKPGLGSLPGIRQLQPFLGIERVNVQGLHA